MLQISESECENIVKKATQSRTVKIENVTSEHFGDFLGFLGEYYRLKIVATINDEKFEFKFFVKSLPIKDLRSHRSMLINTGIFLKEVRIYGEIFNEIDCDDDGDFWRPKTYLLRDDLLVFDDLTLKNFKILDQEMMGRRHIEAVLKALANFHARSLNYENKQKISIGERFKDILFETSVSDDMDWYHAGLETIRQVALKKSLINESESEDFYESIHKSIEIMESSPHGIPYVICHRDVWKNNLMFSSNQFQCVLIDFQTARYLPLSVDVAMVIFCNTEREHFEKLTEHYVNFYFANLNEKLRKFKINSTMIKENLIKSCDYHKQFALIYNCILVMLTKPSPELFSNFEEKDFRDFAENDRYRIVSKFMEQDVKYCQLLVDAVKSVVDLIYRKNKEIKI